MKKHTSTSNTIAFWWFLLLPIPFWRSNRRGCNSFVVQLRARSVRKQRTELKDPFSSSISNTAISTSVAAFPLIKSDSDDDTGTTMTTTTLFDVFDSDKNNDWELLSKEERLYEIGKRLKLEIFDLDEGIYGYDSKDYQYGLKVVHITISGFSTDTNVGIGLELTEMASSLQGGDGRGLVLVSDVYDDTLASANANPEPFQVGDVLTGVSVVGTSFRERLTGLNYDLTVEALGKAKQYAIDSISGSLSFEINRLVRRAPITVEVVDAKGHSKNENNVRTIQALAGENLRRLLQRKNIQLYNSETKRFDMPYATDDCAGEGLCGTCLVAIEKGMDVLSPQDPVEKMLTKDRPVSWRASCRTILGGPDNKGGTIRLRTQPQTGYEDEINPGVRPL